MECSVSLF